MGAKAHGSCIAPPQQELRWGADPSLASHIACQNRRGAEPSGYWEQTGLREAALAAEAQNETMTFYDSITGKPLFVAPIGRTMQAFLHESAIHGWPSFRDAELTSNVRVLRGTGGETVSTDGTHLGHNLPDQQSRYCINLVSVSGRPHKPHGAAGVGLSEFRLT